MRPEAAPLRRRPDPAMAPFPLPPRGLRRVFVRLLRMRRAARFRLVRWGSAVALALLVSASAAAVELEAAFRDPPPEAKPWVLWHWLQAAVSREGITADLEAMRDAGIGGAYLLSIKGAPEPPHLQPPVQTLSPEWWSMVRHAMEEADRLGLKLAMHVGDGFATAGGPWITPELSMQRVVWSERQIEGGAHVDVVLPAPARKHDYYRPLAVFAIPAAPGSAVSTQRVTPRVTTSLVGVNAQGLAAGGNKETLRSETSCWFQYHFDEPFLARSVIVRRSGGNTQAQRLKVEASDDGVSYRFVAQLEPPRHGWQDGDAEITHALPPTAARYFRFSWNPEGSEPGGEALDSAKWRAVLKLQEIELSGAPRLHQFEGKTGAVWRVSPRTTREQVPAALAVKRDEIVDLTANVDANGRLRWQAPPGSWNVFRIGHTSTGHVNATGGAGRGLEADKFNPAAVRLQFDRWFGEAHRVAGPELARRVLKGLLVESWEAGSQNWSVTFEDEFRRRRGYELRPWLLLFAGVPLDSVEESERVLHDVRRTIAELVVDHFYRPLATLAHAHGCWLAAENVAPTMTSDAMAHFSAVDVPMGEFWLRSPTHDKPNDMLDAISAARVYGKRLVQAEAFTELRMAWDEHPGLLKTLGDRQYALGINRFVYHVFAHNPWTDRAPGMTLDGVGLYFQRDQTWWRPGREWVRYAQRVQALLQLGEPVVDVAVFTGEEVPARAVLPESLADVLPGLVGAERVAREQRRRRNEGQPLRERPAGVKASANLVDPQEWVDPLRGYAYDSVNREALLGRAAVEGGALTFPGGARYRVLVLPEQPMPGVASPPRSAELRQFIARAKAAGLAVIEGRSEADAFDGVAPDLVARDERGDYADGLAWTHRRGDGFDLYFVSNQKEVARAVSVSLRVAGRRPELWDPVTGEMRPATRWSAGEGRTDLPLTLHPAESLFIVLREPTTRVGETGEPNAPVLQAVQTIEDSWTLTTQPGRGGPAGAVILDALADWTTLESLRHYSGTILYETEFTWGGPSGRVWLDLGRVENLAEVELNDQRCGVAWTAPLRVEVTAALRSGKNRLRLHVTNTWRNRLIGDSAQPHERRVTFTTAPDRWTGQPLLPAGLLGPVTIMRAAEPAPTDGR